MNKCSASLLSGGIPSAEMHLRSIYNIQGCAGPRRFKLGTRRKVSWGIGRVPYFRVARDPDGLAIPRFDSGYKHSRHIPGFRPDRVRVLPSDLKSNCPLTAVMLVARNESRDSSTSDLEQYDSIETRPIPPETFSDPSRRRGNPSLGTIRTPLAFSIFVGRLSNIYGGFISHLRFLYCIFLIF